MSIDKMLKQRKFEELLAKGYQELSKLDNEIVNASLDLQAMVAEKVWAWDE